MSPEAGVPADGPGSPAHDQPLTGMRAFLIVWLGQVISLLGTSMSAFGLTIWAYERTGSATALSLVIFFYTIPLLALSPLAGALVDRFSRKWIMIASDLASGLSTLVILALHSAGRLEIWHLYLMGAVSGAFQAFQWPAFSAAITTMLPKTHYGRANGLLSLAENGSGVFAPLLAGALLGVIGLTGILLVDVASFLFAVAALLLVRIPAPLRTAAGEESRGSLWRESLFGFGYILQRPSLVGVQLIFMAANFIDGLAFTLTAPLILARTASNELVYGTVSSAGAAGGLLGGLLMSAWGGPSRRIHGILGGWALAGLLGTALMGLGRALPVWIAASFLGALMTPIINACYQALWQAKVAPDVQGRVFAVKRLTAWSTIPLAMLVAGPLADRVMEPAMQSGGRLAVLFRPLLGQGPGAGIALLFLCAGLGTTAVALAGYAWQRVRAADLLLPDHGQEQPPPDRVAIGF